ncbi:hypothetical protein NMG60_11030561 [Bertholletia excelsa]
MNGDCHCHLRQFFSSIVLRNPSSLHSLLKRSIESGCGRGPSLKRLCSCACTWRGGRRGPYSVTIMATATAKVEPYLNGSYDNGGGEMRDRAPMVVAAPPAPAERQTGASMMEQLVPEITTHALSYLDYPSLCRLSMTNSLMRKAANDDNAWKALYHKDFTLEQDNIVPINGWKAYYAATRAIVNVNSEFCNIMRERSAPAMGRLWLNADYVKCIHASGELFTGYNAVMESWRVGFNWEQDVNFQVRDVRVRVSTDMAWVTMKTYFEMQAMPFHMTNVFELHNGRWYIVHHHSSLIITERVSNKLCWVNKIERRYK